MTDPKTDPQDPNPAPTAEIAADPVKLSTKKILAVVNDGAGDEDPETAAALQKALYGFGAQDPSLEFPRSWQRVQRRIGVDPDKLDGVATAEQVAQFADRTGIQLSR